MLMFKIPEWALLYKFVCSFCSMVGRWEGRRFGYRDRLQYRVKVRRRYTEPIKCHMGAFS